MKRLAFLGLGLLSAFIWVTAPRALLGEPSASFRAVPARQTNTQPYPSFNSQRLDEQLVRYQKLLDESGPPDILIVGSSRALQGVDPLALELALAHHGYPGMTVYNFSINGATARVIDLVLRKILPTDRLPKMIIFADGVRAFNSGRVDRTYQAIVESEGYKLLSSGTPPFQTQAPSPEPTQPEVAASAMRISKEEAVEYPELTADRDPREAIAANYQAVSIWLDRVRGEIAKTYERGSTQAMWIRRSEPPASERPTLPSIETVATGQRPEQMQDSGFFPVTTRYNPATYYQKYPRVQGEYDGDYAAFSLQGEQTAALEAIAAFTKSRNIPFVLVNLPLNRDYLDSVRMSSEQQFRQKMQRMATQQGFIFRDLRELWPTQHDYFADPSHLNRYGAFAVALQLAQDQTIPWSKARR